MNFDDLFDQDFIEDDASVDGGEYASDSLNVTGGEVDPNAGTALDRVYDEHKRLYLMVDVSGSMNQKMLPDYADIKAVPTNSDAEMVREIANDPTNRRFRKLFRKTGYPVFDARFPAWLGAQKQASNQEIKNALKADLEVCVHLGVTLEDKESGVKRPSKIKVLQELASEAVSKRYAKYPESRISVVPFESKATVLDCRDLEQALGFLRGLMPTGGTYIAEALDKVLHHAKKAPSPVNLHHIIMVTDGECLSLCGSEEAYAAKLREQGFVLDVISIYSDMEIVSASAGGCSTASAGKQSLIDLCEATGGTYTEARTCGSFKAQYLAAATRLLLTSGS